MSQEFTENDWRRLIASIGEDPDRPGLLETPARVAKAWQHWTSGYAQDPAALLKAFEDGAEQYNEFIIVRNIPVYSHCEHHLAPFFGKATIGYHESNPSWAALADTAGESDCIRSEI